MGLELAVVAQCDFIITDNERGFLGAECFGIEVNVLSLRLPKTMYTQLRNAAKAEGISMNQFIMLAVAEKIATLSTVNYLEERAQRGSREKFLAVLEKAPDVEPENDNRL